MKTESSPRPVYRRWWFILIVAIIAIVVVNKIMDDNKNKVSTPASGKETSESNPAPSVDVDAATLIKAYKENELGADKQYKGKSLKISGTFDHTSDVLNRKVVWISDGSEFPVTQIACTISDSQVDKAAALKKGQPITVTGKGGGFDGLSVDVKNCALN